MGRRTLFCVFMVRVIRGLHLIIQMWYPPVFFAVGREDSALDNLNAVLPDLLAHGVETEVHTFAGVPHGQGGITIVGEKTYPNFQLWLQLADVFLQDVFQRQRQK